MGATPVCQITAAGIVRPDFDACLGYVQALYRSIYGVDLYLGADSQDGQFMALLANAIHDCNGETVAVYNAFSPSTAQGAGLSSVVKINGIRRMSPTASTSDVLIVGQASSVITSGSVRDANGNLWDLPASVIIPSEGQVLVTATCRTLGAIAAPAGTITGIATPTLGWQSVINPQAAAVGAPVETDSALRQRQALSTALPALTPLETLQGALLAIDGVTACTVTENDTPVPDAVTGIPGNTIAVVIDGGDADLIAQVIRLKKTPGVGTYGDILKTMPDAYGVPKPVRFFRSKQMLVGWYVTIRAKRGYTVDVAAAIKQALSDYTNGLGIGVSQQLADAYPAALLNGDARKLTYEIVGLRAERANTSADNYGDLICAFNERLMCSPDDVSIAVVP